MTNTKIIRKIVQVLVRVFMRAITTEGYLQVFEVLFPLLQEVAKDHVHWHHIHGFGISSITTDLCAKQAAGEC
jgi:hypothetical protein